VRKGPGGISKFRNSKDIIYRVKTGKCMQEIKKIMKLHTKKNNFPFKIKMLVSRQEAMSSIIGSNVSFSVPAIMICFKS
jgi:hypothetical protein